jgi:hypothetical protein
VALYLSGLPVWAAMLLLVVLPTLLTIAISLMLRRWIGHQNLATNNEIAGFKFAVVGVIFAVLLAFATVVVWEKFSDAEVAVVDEAGASATLYRLAAGQDDDLVATRTALTSYLKLAVDKDWPAMAKGGESSEVTKALDDLYAAALTVTHDETRHPALAGEIFQQLDTITHARRDRLHLAAGIVPSIIWVVLYGSAVLTVGFTFFFGTQNWRAQLLMTAILAVLVFLGLLVIVEIDHPFTGPTYVDSGPLETVFKDFGYR